MKMHHTINPFNFETPADRRSFTDRETLLPRLLKFMEQPRQRALVYGRRRMGKTSLIKHAARVTKGDFGFVDLSTATDLREVAKKLLASVPVSDDGDRLARTLKVLKRHVKTVSLKGGKFFGFEADLREPPEETLDQVLAFLNDYAGATTECLVVCMDEFQEIRRLSGPKAEWRLRGNIQHHEHLSYIFSGSDHRLLHWMTEPNAAFYKQARGFVEVGPIDPELLPPHSKWISRSLPHRRSVARRDSLPDAMGGATAGPCTGDIVRLAKQVFEFAAEQRHGKIVVEAAFDAISLDYCLAPDWSMLSGNR